MNKDLEEQLEEASEHLAQARAILSDLAERIGSSGDDEPDDETEITADLENMAGAIEEIESTLEDLRESVQE